MPKFVDLSRLSLAVRQARLALRRCREERREAVRQYVGQHWSEEGTAKKVPVNLIALYCSIVGRSLIAKNPRGLISTFQKPNKPAVSAMQSWANKEVEQMRLATTLQRVVMDALFSIGICKVALSAPADSAKVAWNLKVGTPFAERVDLDDFVFDIHARDFTEVSYIGHRYRTPLEAIKDSTIYTSARKDLEASQDQPYNLEGDERVKQLGQTYQAGQFEEFEEHVDLWEFYIPRKRLVITVADDSMSGPDLKILREQEWLGPDCGPYHLLSLGIVPGNAMPKAPIQDLIDLHEAVNENYRKLMRQAQRQKTNTWVQGGATEDGDRVIKSNDGDAIRVDNPEKIRQTSTEGPNQGNFLFYQDGWELFSKMAGNLEMMGGLSPQSKTATQDKMLMASASSQVASMQDTVVNFTADVFKGLCWYWWHHPELEMRTQHSLPGMPEFSIDRTVTPQQRMRARWSDLDITIDPYSMQHQTPQARVQALTQVVAQMQPMMALLQQQGIMFNVNAYLQKIASYLDMPDLGDIFTIQEPPAQVESAPVQPGAPAETTRNYVRRSLGGESEQASTENIRSQLEKGMANGQGNGQINPGGMG